MPREKVPEGVYQVIILSCYAIRFEQKSVGALDMDLIITMGKHKGERLDRRIFLGTDLAKAKALFVRLGGNLRDETTVEEDAKALRGNLLRVQVKHDPQGRVKPLIFGSEGRDDPERYL